jgi:hypothetical protein
MLVQPCKRSVSCLLVVLAAAAMACEGGEDEGALPSLDSAVAAGDAAIPGADTAVVGGGTTGGATGGSGVGSPGTQGGGFTGAMGGIQDAGGVPGGRMDAGGGGAGDAGREAGPSASDAGSTAVGDGGDVFAELRQVCLDTINMYRATLGRTPLMRASATLESCSDMGAKYDGDMKKGHASTQIPGKGPRGEPGRLCGSPELGPQNTCPGWGVGPRTGNATLADALKKCLAAMWAENEPPQGVDACKQAYFNKMPECFLAHGHWINMQEPMATHVSCGFYDMGNNTYWMNQDFVVRFR